MNSTKEVEEFFETYIDYIKQLFPQLGDHYASQTEKDESARKFIEDGFAIESPGMTEETVHRIEASSGLTLPHDYREFLMANSYANIEIPIVRFPPTCKGSTTLGEMIHENAGQSVIAFARDESEIGSYCIDLNNKGAIVFVSPRTANDESKLVLATSFLRLLLFLKEFIAWGANIDGLDEEDRAEALEELQGIDPMGIGGDAWEKFWLPRLTSRPP